MAKDKRGLKRSREQELHSRKRSRVENESRGPSDDLHGSTRQDELSSSSASSADEDTSPDETAPPRRRRSEARRITSKEEIIMMLKGLQRGLQDLQRYQQKLESGQECILRKISKTWKEVKKLSKQLELHKNGTSGDGGSTVERSSISNQVQETKYKLVFISGNIGVPFVNGTKKNIEYKIEMGQTIDITVEIVDRTENRHPASVGVELLVLDDKAFNQYLHQSIYWPIEELEKCISLRTTTTKQNPAQRKPVKVSGSQFNLVDGVGSHSCSINVNSGNSKFRLAVRVVSSSGKERVLEGFSNPFYVRDLAKPNKQKKAQVANGNQAQNGQMSNVQNPSYPNLTQDDGNRQVTTPVLSTEPATNQQIGFPTMPEDWNNNEFGPVYQPQFPLNTNVLDTSQQHQAVPMGEGFDAVLRMLLQQPQHGVLSPASLGRLRNADTAYTEPSTSQVPQAYRPPIEDHGLSLTHPPMHNGTSTSFNIQEMFPVRLILDMPDVVRSKHSISLLDLPMSLHSCWQPKFKNSGLPTACLMQDRFGSLTTMPKKVMQNRRGRGVLIESLEPDDSDDGLPQKTKLHSKYQLRFVNKVCETYYTWDQIKADEGNLLKVALFDENNTKITFGPLSSASVEVVALHGDFNDDGQDEWTSEEFNRSVCLCPLAGEETSSILGGDRILVLADGEACLGDAFFQITSFCARTGKFKMGVMLASAQDERVREGLSEPFRVMDKDNRIKGFNPAAATLLFPRNTVTEAIARKEMASPSSTSNNSALSPVAASGTTTSGVGAPCAACKFLRRKCLPGCVFAPYFPPEEPQKFANVHRVFGASNMTKLLNELLPHQREDAVSSLAYEAEARVKDPVYGCFGAISVLQRQVHRLQKELDAAHAELLRYACGDVAAGIPTALPVSMSVSAAPRLSTAVTTTSPGHHQFAAAAATAHAAACWRLGVLDGAVAAPPPLPPAGECYFMRNHSNVNSRLTGGADVAPVLPYASMANWATNAISASTITTSGSESIGGLDHKEEGDSSM